MRGRSRGAEGILHFSYCKGTTFPLRVVRICPRQSASVLLFYGENLRHRCRSVRRSTPPPAVAAVSCWASCPRPSVCSCEAPAIAGASVWKCRRWRPALFLSVLSYRFSVWFRRLSFRLFTSLFRRSNIDSDRIYIEFPSNLY